MSPRRTLIGVLALLGALAGLPVPAADAVTAVNAVGSLARMNPDAVAAFGSIVVPPSTHPLQGITGTLLPVPDAGQLWQVYPYIDGSAHTGILVRDQSTLAVTGSFVVDERLRRGAPAAFGGEWMHAVDGADRVFLVGELSIVEVDVATSTWSVLPVARLDVVAGRRLPGLAIAGVTYDAALDDLLVLYSGPGATAAAHRGVILQRIDLATGADQRRTIRSCEGGLPAVDSSTTYAAPVVIGSTDLYVACNGAGFGQFLPAPQVVVRLPLASLFDPLGAEHAVSGPGTLDGVVVDESSGRLFLLSSSGTVSAFDTSTMTYAWTVNVTSAGSWTGLGHNPATGEVYFQSDLGFGVVDGTAATAPTPFLAGSPANGQERIVSRGGTNQVFVLTGVVPSRAAAYTLYEVLP